MFESRRAGRHFLQIPGPTNVPDRILRAIDRPTIDHRGPAFQRLARTVLDGLARIVRTSGPVIVYPSSGTGAWEAALVNTLSLGDRVLMVETGHFATLWKEMAARLGLEVLFLEGDWRSAVDPARIEAVLAEDRKQRIRAVAIVHNETSTGVRSEVPAVRRAIDRVGHPALLLVDTISSLASMDYRHEEWGVDVTVGASQKGLMLPPGLGFNAVSAKALAAHRKARLPRSYWDWSAMLEANAKGFFPYTPATNLLYGLAEAIAMLEEEGLERVFARHDRFAHATRAAVRAWGLEIVARDPGSFSSSLTGVFVPDGVDADRLRALVLERFDLSLGAGLGKLARRAFRIGHLGDLNEPWLLGTLAAVEAGLELCGVRLAASGLEAAKRVLMQPWGERDPAGFRTTG